MAERTTNRSAYFLPRFGSRRQKIGKMIAAKISSGRQPVASAKQKIDNKNRALDRLRRSLSIGDIGAIMSSRTEISRNRSPKTNSSPSTAFKKNWVENARQIVAKRERARPAPSR